MKRKHYTTKRKSGTMLTSAGRTSVKGNIDILWFLWRLNFVRHFVVFRHVNVLRHLPLGEVDIRRGSWRGSRAWHVDHVDQLSRQLGGRLGHSWSRCSATTRSCWLLLNWSLPIVDLLGRTVQACQVGRRGHRGEERRGGDRDRPGHRRGATGG